jgi:hypothetical protein
MKEDPIVTPFDDHDFNPEEVIVPVGERATFLAERDAERKELDAIRREALEQGKNVSDPERFATFDALCAAFDAYGAALADVPDGVMFKDLDAALRLRLSAAVTAIEALEREFSLEPSRRALILD